MCTVGAPERQAKSEMLPHSWHAGQRWQADLTAHSCAPAGHLGDRLNLRYFLTAGMLGSAALTCAFGAGQLLGIHKMWYFTVVQACAGECHAIDTRLQDSFPWFSLSITMPPELRLSLGSQTILRENQNGIPNLLQAYHRQAVKKVQQPGCGELWASVPFCFSEDSPVRRPQAAGCRCPCLSTDSRACDERGPCRIALLQHAAGRWAWRSTAGAPLLAALWLGDTTQLASPHVSTKRLASLWVFCWLLCRLRPGLRLALGGQHHGQLVWQGQEGAGHGCLEQPHLGGQHAGEHGSRSINCPRVWGLLA